MNLGLYSIPCSCVNWVSPYASIFLTVNDHIISLFLIEDSTVHNNG